MQLEKHRIKIDAFLLLFFLSIWKNKYFNLNASNDGDILNKEFILSFRVHEIFHVF